MDTKELAALELMPPLTPDTTIVELFDDYRVKIDPGPALVLRCGHEVESAASRFTHDNVIAKVAEVMDFKHYHPIRGKWWTQRAGVMTFIAIPKERIQLVRYKGYSYPYVCVDGLRLRLNVSGGTMNPGWCDWIGCAASTGVGIPVQKMQQLAGVAWTPKQCKDAGLILNLRSVGARYNEYMELAAAKLVQPRLGPGVKLMLGGGYRFESSKGPFTIRERRRKGARQFMCDVNAHQSVRVAYKNIDWLATLAANGWDLPAPPVAWNKVGEITPEKD